MTATHSPPSELPLRPRLRPGTPILRRPQSVQVGVDRPEAIVIAPAGQGLDRWLRLLDGSHGVADLCRAGARLGLERPDLLLVLDRLMAADLIDAEVAARDRGVRLIGAGRIGRAVARSLARSELTHLDLVDDDPVDRRLYPRHSGLGPQSSALQAELARERTTRQPGPRISVAPASGNLALASVDAGRPAIAPPAPDLTLIATDRLDVDRMVTDALLRSDQAHLLVRGADDGIVVGPLVVPGQTACVRCTDLVRCDADPDWPAILAELCRTFSRTPDPLIDWAAGTAATQVLGLLADPSGRPPETAGATLELGRDYRPRRRNWPRHPMCGCAWTQGRGSSVAAARLAC